SDAGDARRRGLYRAAAASDRRGDRARDSADGAGAGGCARGDRRRREPGWRQRRPGGAWPAGGGDPRLDREVLVRPDRLRRDRCEDVLTDAGVHTMKRILKTLALAAGQIL